MEKYEKPELEELGQLHDVTGGLFDSLLEAIFGPRRPRPPLGGSA